MLRSLVAACAISMALLESVTAVPNCYRKVTSGRTGGGCCDTVPPLITQCDHFVYTYNADCIGNCPPYKECVSTGDVVVLVYWYQDCYGDCMDLPESCALGEYLINYGPEPGGCECRPLI